VVALEQSCPAQGFAGKEPSILKSQEEKNVNLWFESKIQGMNISKELQCLIPPNQFSHFARRMIHERK